MSFIRYIQKVQYLDFLIRTKATGSQKDFARKANMSKSTLNEYLNDMKDLGFPIAFDRSQNTYYYIESGQMVASLFEKMAERNIEE